MVALEPLPSGAPHLAPPGPSLPTVPEGAPVGRPVALWSWPGEGGMVPDGERPVWSSGGAADLPGAEGCVVLGARAGLLAPASRGTATPTGRAGAHRGRRGGPGLGVPGCRDSEAPRIRAHRRARPCRSRLPPGRPGPRV